MTLLKQITKTALPSHHLPHKVEAHVLEVSNLSVHYDGTVALEGINFKLEAGERVAVVGPNGAGKSTLFKVIAGVLAPSQGEVKIYGDTPGGHICIAYIPQRSQVDWNFPVNVADVVMMGRIGKLGLFRWPKASDWEYVHECLETVGLAHLARQQIGELSGGQQQRMFIARALAQDAAIMLMDEPFTGLDMTSQEGILNLLDVLHQRGVTILISTHDLNLASAHFEQVMLLNRRLMGFGSPAEVFTTERLLQAFGGHLRLMEDKDHLIAVSDTCCEGDSQV